MSHRFGIIRGNNNDTYSIVGNLLTGFTHSVVGLFCIVNDVSTIVLFRTFDGTSSFCHFNSILDLAECESVSDLEISYFVEQECDIFYETKISDRLATSIHNSLLENNPIPDYENILKSILSLEERRTKNGYVLVNEILSTTFHIQSQVIKNDDISLNRFSLPWTSMNETIKKPKLAHIQLEVENSLETLFKTFNILMQNPFFVEAVCKHSLSEKYSPLPSVKSELESLRTFIESILENPECPIIQLDVLIHIHNRLVKKIDGRQDHLIIPAMDGFSSRGVLITDFRCNLEEVPLSTSSRLVAIPTTETCFQNFSENELIQILRYIRSIQIDSRYHNVADRIVKELAERVKIVHP